MGCFHILMLMLDCFSLTSIESIVKVETLCIFPLNILSRTLSTTPAEKGKGRLLHLTQGGKTESAMQTKKSLYYGVKRLTFRHSIDRRMEQT